MVVFNISELEAYVKTHHRLVFSTNTPLNNHEETFDDFCDHCQRDTFFRLRLSSYTRLAGSGDYTDPEAYSLLVQCPRCKRNAWVILVLIITDLRVPVDPDDQDLDEYVQDGSPEFQYDYYRITRIPEREEEVNLSNIPSEYSSLRDTVAEAQFCLEHGKYVASSILYRRAIEVLAKQVLGASGKTLHLKLQWLEANPNQLGIDLTSVFHENAKIIKDVGNQGAHPDDDPDLHTFSRDDANGLHDLFTSIIHEVFVKPAAMKKLQEDLQQSRKLKLRTGNQPT